MELKTETEINSTSFKLSSTSTLDPLHQPKPKPKPKPTSPVQDMTRYRECQRNHAAHLGGHVVDGCGEFMPAGDEGTPLALKCAACDCHRNFHRRETDSATTTTSTATTTAAPPPLLPPPPLTATTATANCYISFNHNNNNNHPRPQKNPTIRPSMGPAITHSRAPVMMAFGGGGPAESSSEDLNAYREAVAGGGQIAMEHYSGGSSKKRFRTKFTQDQKDKMSEFAEKIGWRIQKQDDAEVHRFCNEVGIKRQVFKVWLHNNKQALKRKQS